MISDTETNTTAVRDAIAILLARAREDGPARANLEGFYFADYERTFLILATFERLSESLLRLLAAQMQWRSFERFLEELALLLAAADEKPPPEQGPTEDILP